MIFLKKCNLHTNLVTVLKPLYSKYAMTFFKPWIVAKAASLSCLICLLPLIQLITIFFLTLLEEHLGVQGKALQILKSYLSNRTQCVTIDGISSSFADLLFGVPQGSVLGPIQFCIYTLPLGAILRAHDIGYHIYADDTQLYLSFDYKNPEPSLARLTAAIADVRTWMINNNLKINDDKTQFFILSSSRATTNENLSSNMHISTPET